MKKILSSIFILVFLFILFVQKSEAVYYTRFLTDKITLKEGYKVSICPIKSQFTRKDLMTRSQKGLDPEQLINWFRLSYQSPCEGEKEDIILGRIIYNLRNKQNEGLEDYIYIFKNRLLRPNTGLIAFFDKGQNETVYVPDGYVQSDTTYDIDPTNIDPKLKDVSKKLDNSGTLWYQGNLSKILNEETLKKLQGFEVSGKLPIFIFDDKLYIVNSEKETLTDKLLLDFSSDNTLPKQPDLKDFNPFVYPNSEFIKEDCDNLCKTLGWDTTYQWQTSDYPKNIEAFFNSLKGNAKEGWNCEIPEDSNKLNGYNSILGNCEKGDLKKDHLKAEFRIYGDPESENYVARDEKRSEITKVNISGGLTASSAAQIVTIASSLGNPLVYYIELSIHSPGDESQQLKELNGFPVYPGSSYLGKEGIMNCRDDIIYGRCNSDEYIWSTKNSYKEVSDWFIKNNSKFGWNCYVRDYDSYYISNTFCKKGDLEYGLSISRYLYTDYVSDNSTTGIYVFIPNKESVNSRPSPHPRPLNEWSDFPFFPNISFSNPENLPECKHLDSDLDFPWGCGETIRIAYVKGDQTNQIKDWYKNVAGNWKCRESDFEFQGEYYFNCSKEPEEIIGGPVKIQYNKDYSETRVIIGVLYHVDKEKEGSLRSDSAKPVSSTLRFDRGWKFGEDSKLNEEIGSEIKNDLEGKDLDCFSYDVTIIKDNSAGGKCGGEENAFWIAKKDKIWKVIWRGKNAPNCYTVDKYNIPEEIYGNCYLNSTSSPIGNPSFMMTPSSGSSSSQASSTATPVR